MHLDGKHMSVQFIHIQQLHRQRRKRLMVVACLCGTHMIYICNKQETTWLCSGLIFLTNEQFSAKLPNITTRYTMKIPTTIQIVHFAVLHSFHQKLTIKMQDVITFRLKVSNGVHGFWSSIIYLHTLAKMNKCETKNKQDHYFESMNFFLESF